MRKYLLLVLALVGGGSLPATGQSPEVELTPFYGYRLGGEVQEFTTGTSFDLQDAETYGLIFDKKIAPARFLELLWSHQETVVDATRIGSRRFGADIDYFHLGVMNERDSGQTRPFVATGAGVTYLSPDENGLASDTRFSVNLGGGVRAMLGAEQRIGLRLEGRVYGTFVNSNGAVWCSGGGGGGGCAFAFNGNVLWQAEVNAGVVLAF